MDARTESEPIPMKNRSTVERKSERYLESISGLASHGRQLQRG
jgi:hypothetical protein